MPTYSNSFEQPAGKPKGFGQLEPEFTQPYQQYTHDPSPENASNLLRSLKPVLTSGVKAHVGQTNAISNSQAKRLALRAIKTYDPRQSKLSTHIHNNLKGLKRMTRQQTSGLRVPERIVLDHSAMMRAENELKEEIGREPTAEELADYSKFSLARIAKLRRYQPGVSTGMLQSGEKADQDWNPAVQQPESDMWNRLVYGELGEIDKKIMEWTLGMYGSPILDNQTIARKLNVTPGAVSQRKAKLQQKLDAGLDRGRFRV
jgi:DNA-directed RNA polymerase specialized sigma subunit